MIWLAALGGAGPISATGSVIATPTIAGVKWNLYYGLNGSMKVYSFVASSQVTSFSGDLKLFFTYLATSQGYSTSQYITSIGAGTEPFIGTSAVMTTSAYSVVINLGTSTGTDPTTSTPATGGSVPLYGQCGE
jgi:xyloglucan-specific endo-beta-1,4-glucanase